MLSVVEQPPQTVLCSRPETRCMCKKQESILDSQVGVLNTLDPGKKVEKVASEVFSDDDQKKATLTVLTKKTYDRPSKLQFLKHERLFGLTPTKKGSKIPLLLMTLCFSTNLFETLCNDYVRHQSIYLRIFINQFKRGILTPFSSVNQMYNLKDVKGVVGYINNLNEIQCANHNDFSCFLQSILKRFGVQDLEVAMTSFTPKLNEKLPSTNIKVYLSHLSLVPILDFSSGDKKYLNTTDQYMERLCEKRGVYTDYLCLAKASNCRSAILPSPRMFVRSVEYELVAVIAKSHDVGVVSYNFEGDMVFEYGYYKGGDDAPNLQQQKEDGYKFCEGVLDAFTADEDRISDEIHTQDENSIGQLFSSLAYEVEVSDFAFSFFGGFSEAIEKQLNTSQKKDFLKVSSFICDLLDGTFQIQEQGSALLHARLFFVDIFQVENPQVEMLRAFFNSFLEAIDADVDEVKMTEIRGHLSDLLEDNKDLSKEKLENYVRYVNDFFIRVFDTVEYRDRAHVSRSMNGDGDLYYQIDGAIEDYKDRDDNPLHVGDDDFKRRGVSIKDQEMFAGPYNDVRYLARHAEMFIYKKVD